MVPFLATTIRLAWDIADNDVRMCTGSAGWGQGPVAYFCAKLHKIRAGQYVG
jgi:hypothetical protein